MPEIPIAPTKPTDRPGYEYDPYRDEHDEILTFRGRILYNGLFSSWREIHISIRAIAAGLRAGELSQIPECPPLWGDEGQYWDGCAMIANIAKVKGSAIIATLIGVYAFLRTKGLI